MSQSPYIRFGDTPLKSVSIDLTLRRVQGTGSAQGVLQNHSLQCLGLESGNCRQEAPEGAAFRMVQELTQAFQQNRLSFQNKQLSLLPRLTALSLNGAPMLLSPFHALVGLPTLPFQLSHKNWLGD